MRERTEEMGMSDLQFKAWLREIIASLEKAKTSENQTQDLNEIIQRLEKALED